MAKKISKANVLRWKILLRLNLDEEDHLQLARILDDMQKVSRFSEQPNLADKAADQARRVLKREWAAAKYGIWANLRLHLKRARRGLWSWITVRLRWLLQVVRPDHKA